MKKPGLLLLLIILCLLLLSGCVDGTEYSQLHISKSSELSSLGDGELIDGQAGQDGLNIGLPSVLISQNDALALYYHSDPLAISILDKNTGYLWSSVGQRAVTEDMSLNNTWLQNVDSLLNVTYTMLNSQQREQTSTDSLLKMKFEHRAYAMPNGMRLVVSLTKQEIDFVIEFSLTENGLDVYIPIQGIIEHGDSKLYSLEVMPFFGAANNTEKGYLFYPDGSGAIMDFQEQLKTSRNPAAYRLAIFSGDGYQYLGENYLEESNKGIALLPVFGLKKEEGSYVCYITKGAQDGTINVYPSGFGVALNRISSTFIFRRSFDVVGSALSISGGTSTGPLYVKIEDELIDCDKAMHYEFLSGDYTGYDAMAGTYREYLKHNDMLPELVKNSEEGPSLILNLFMGITKDRILLNQFISMTTFEQAQEILDEIEALGVTNLEVILKGWYSGGYGRWPQGNSPDGALGGMGNLEDLVAYCKQRGWDIYLDANVIDIVKDNSGFSTRTDVVKDGNQFILSDYRESQYIFNPVSALYRFSELAENLKDMGVGVSLERIGSYIYDDYQETFNMHKFQTVYVWQELLDSANESFTKVGIVGGNEYALKNADLLMEIPMKDSGIFITTRDVPFYQMVVHGHIPYTDSPANLYYDLSKQTLEMIERGYIPTFELTYEQPYLLRDVNYILFSSDYRLWTQRLADMYATFQRLAPVYQEEMITHSKLSDTLVRVGYGNGYALYVNYAKESVKINGHEVPGEDFLIVLESK